MDAIPSVSLLHLPLWQSVQVKLQSVVRWSKYLNKEKGVRRQDSLQHSFSIVLLGATLLEQLRPYLVLDVAYLLTALMVHDVGEGEVGKDTLYIDKHVSGDIAEYCAFMKLISSLEPDQRNMLERAFLLQFALKNPQEFVERTRQIMSELASTHRMEALLFDAIERWDYVLYALEQYQERQNAMILVQVLRHQMPHLERLAGDIPGFREEVWTPEMQTWCKGFLVAHMGQWEEKKGEA